MDVLLVDDDPDVRHLLAFTLEAHGLSVRTAGDGETALLQLLADPPGCVVLDLMLPEVDGFTVLERFRSHVGRDTTKVLVLSCRSDEASQSRAAALGADGYLVKPTDPDALVASIVRLAGLAVR